LQQVTSLEKLSQFQTSIISEIRSMESLCIRKNNWSDPCNRRFSRQGAMTMAG
jgi:hypothetical protein